MPTTLRLQCTSWLQSSVAKTVAFRFQALLTEQTKAHRSFFEPTICVCKLPKRPSAFNVYPCLCSLVVQWFSELKKIHSLSPVWLSIDSIVPCRSHCQEPMMSMISEFCNQYLEQAACHDSCDLVGANTGSCKRPGPQCRRRVPGSSKWIETVIEK